jgi:hypothetical protein
MSKYFICEEPNAKIVDIISTFIVLHMRRYYEYMTKALNFRFTKSDVQMKNIF